MKRVGSVLSRSELNPFLHIWYHTIRAQNGPCRCGLKYWRYGVKHYPINQPVSSTLLTVIIQTMLLVITKLRIISIIVHENFILQESCLPFRLNHKIYITLYLYRQNKTNHFEIFNKSSSTAYRIVKKTYYE